MPGPTIAIRNKSLEPFRALLDADAASAAAVLLPRPQQGLFSLVEARWLVLRAWLQDAEAEAATVDVLYWWNHCAKGALACRLTLTAGAGSSGLHPLKGAPAGTWFEADSAVKTPDVGLVRPVVLVHPDGQMLVWLPTLDADACMLRCESIGTAARVLVAGRAADDLPAQVSRPWVGEKSASAAALTDEILEDFAAVDLPLPASGLEYVLEDVWIESSGGVTVTLHTETSGGGKLWGAFSLPAGLAQLALNVRVGAGKRVRVTTSSFSGRIQARGRVAAVE